MPRHILFSFYHLLGVAYVSKGNYFQEWRGFFLFLIYVFNSCIYLEEEEKNVGMNILTEPPIVACFQDLEVFNDIISGGILFFVWVGGGEGGNFGPHLEFAILARAGRSADWRLLARLKCLRVCGPSG